MADDELESQLRERIADVPLAQLQSQRAVLSAHLGGENVERLLAGTKLCPSSSSDANRSLRQQETKQPRRRKGAPREISSKKRPRRSGNDFGGTTKNKSFDPRFNELSTKDSSLERADRRYAFLDEMREEEIESLSIELKKKRYKDIAFSDSKNELLERKRALLMQSNSKKEARRRTEVFKKLKKSGGGSKREALLKDKKRRLRKEGGESAVNKHELKRQKRRQQKLLAKKPAVW